MNEGMTIRGTGIRQRTRRRPLPASPAPGGPHQWVITGVWRISPEKVGREEFHLDTENLLAVDGPGCWVCEQPYRPAIANGPCPGDPAGR
jgi:hypothetical protein